MMKYFLMGLTLIMLFFLHAELVADKLYTWTDEKGVVHISKDPPPKNTKIDDVMNYKPETEAEVQNVLENERREEMQDEAAPKKESVQKEQKSKTKAEENNDDEIYIDREGKRIRRAEETKEVREQHQERRRSFRRHRR
jgi:hypothetical protein